MAENENENETDYSSEVPTAFAAALLFLLVCAVGAAFYFALHPPTTCEVNNATAQAQAVANKSLADSQTAYQKRLQDLQMEVIKQCVGKGNLPVVSNGNVDCRPVTK